MPIVLVRHGEASSSHGLDDDRTLSLAGRAEVRALAKALALRGVRPTAMMGSPLVRAVQTAELLAQGLGFEGALVVERGLTPDGDVMRMDRLLRAQPGTVIVVTHEPFVRSLCACLTGQSSARSFRTAECAVIDGGQQLYRLHPETA